MKQQYKKMMVRGLLAAITVGATSLPGWGTTFSGAIAFRANADGSWAGSGVTSTGCCQSIIVEPTTYGNPIVSLPYALTLGTNVLYLASSPDWTAGYGVTTGGLNLFFNGNATPGVSAHTAPVYDKTAATSFAVTAAGISTLDLIQNNLNSSGSLAFDDGTNTVTLTGLQWVGGSGVNPYDASFTVQKVTLLVTKDTGPSTPEPATWAAMVSGLALLAARKRFKA